MVVQKHLFLDQHQHKSNSLRHQPTLGSHFRWGFWQGGIWDFREVYTPWDPDGAVIRLDHLIAVGRGLRVWVGCRRSQNRPSADTEVRENPHFWEAAPC